MNRYISARLQPPRRVVVDTAASRRKQASATTLNATARTGRGFVLDQAPFDATRDVQSASAADGSAAAPEKLKLLEDELSKLRAEINAMMMAPSAAAALDDSLSAASLPPPPPPLLASAAAPPQQAKGIQFQLPPPPPPITTAAAATTNSTDDAPIDCSLAPMPPSLPSAESRDAVESKKRSRRATIALMSPPAQVKSVKVDPAVRPSEGDVRAGRAGLRRTEVRRSLGGTPWRTPPKERAKRALDAEDDPDAPVDQQTMIARALRKKFASIRIPSPQKKGGVVLGANHRPHLADVSHNQNQNSLAM
jgi:hypothetical protein